MGQGWVRTNRVHEQLATTAWGPESSQGVAAPPGDISLQRRLEELKWSVIDNLSRLIDQGIQGPSPRRTQTESELNKSVGCEQLERPVRGFLSIPTTRRYANAVVANQKTNYKITIKVTAVSKWIPEKLPPD